MKSIDFTKVEAVISFEGETREFNVAKRLGNLMMFNSSVLLDIGFEDLAKEIYYSNGAVEVDEKYVPYIEQIVTNSEFIAAVKRAVIKLLRTASV